MHVYRWDLDRTYLDTEIHSVRGLLRTALETAEEKRNIPGSAALLRALTRKDPDARVSILSGSPRQMRSVLEEKLALDGIRVDRLILKDNLGNIRRGRLRAVRGQVGYKLPALLKARIGLGPAVRESLFGDDSEVDALVYTVYAEAVAGRLSPAELARIMEAGGAYSDSVEEAVDALRHVGRADAVEDIFIHVDRGVPVRAFARLSPRVIPVFSWFQAAAVLWARGRLAPAGLAEVAKQCIDERHDVGEVAVAGWIQDVVRRGHLSLDQAHDLLTACHDLAPVHAPVRRALDALGDAPRTQPRPSANPLDFLEALKQLS
ncbi:MAG: hypothetical protein EP330_29945 [Deltaproteobacteria bacterium]|nr:MAG: hypothetical protein EP330_29945 [Deltaproteobacteria bacterium]